MDGCQTPRHGSLPFGEAFPFSRADSRGSLHIYDSATRISKHSPSLTGNPPFWRTTFLTRGWALIGRPSRKWDTPLQPPHRYTRSYRQYNWNSDCPASDFRRLWLYMIHHIRQCRPEQHHSCLHRTRRVDSRQYEFKEPTYQRSAIVIECRGGERLTLLATTCITCALDPALLAIWDGGRVL